MNLFTLFKTKKKIPLRQESVSPEASEEIIHVFKCKRNKFEKNVAEKFKRTLLAVSENSKITFKRIKMDTRIGDYDNETFELVRGFFYQVDKMIKSEKIIIGSLIVKAMEDDVEIHLNYIQGVAINRYLNRKFKNDFGNWQVYEQNGVCVSAFFSKSAFSLKKNERKSVSQKSQEALKPKDVADEIKINSESKRGLYV